jgi:hypothetical protein
MPPILQFFAQPGGEIKDSLKRREKMTLLALILPPAI